MPGTISNHHVEYRIRAGATPLHALIPSLDRALESSLGDALEERLATSLGDNEEVVVVREARVAVALTLGDCRLGSSVANRVSTAAAESITAILKAPQDADKVARFENQAAFAGAFIVDLLASRAWDRWCYGPFRRYRRATMLETIAAVLDENDRVGILRWLRSHGHDDACAILESDARLTDGEAESRHRLASSSGAAVLVDAAHRILRALGWPENVAALNHAVNAEIVRREIPAWTDVRQLSTWVIDLVLAVFDGAAEAWTPDPASLDRLDALLAADLDWLDVPLVRGEIQRVVAHTPLRDPAAGALLVRAAPADPIAVVLRGLTLRIRAGLVPLSGVNGPEAMLGRLMNAARVIDVERRASEDQLVAALRSVARSWWMKTGSELRAGDLARNVMPGDTGAPDASGDRPPRTVESQFADRGEAPLDAAAAALLDVLSKTADEDETAGVGTTAAGLFLLTRPVLDLRLPALARECGLPLPSVLALIAQALFGLTLPLDAASAAWVGDAEPRHLEEHEAPQLKQLQRMIELTVADQGVLGASALDPDVHPLAAHVVRAWARWLPGVHGSSVGHLVRNCLMRTGTVRITRLSLDVRLDPAPLDVVLEMAGCFRPIDTVGWLDGRRMTFALSR